MSQVPKSMVKQLVLRDGLVCQWCGVQFPELNGYPVVFHHRRNRGHGGGVHLLSELVTVCSGHNQAFEDGLRDEPLVRGFRIPRNTITHAEEVPLVDAEGRAWFLTNRGTRIKVEAEMEVPC